MDREHHGHVCRQYHRRKVAQRIVRQFLVQARISGVPDGVHEQRVAVGIRFGNDSRRHDSVRAWTIIDHHLLTPSAGQPFADAAGQKVS